MKFLFLFLSAFSLLGQGFDFGNAAWVGVTTPPPASGGGGGGDITTGLTVWYKFDEGSGSTATDSSGNGNTGTETAGSTYVAGQIGPHALDFNATENPVTLTPVSASGDTFTIAAWIFPTTASANYQFISWDSDYGLGLHGDTIDMYESGDHLSPSVIVPNVWQHVAVVVNAGVGTWYYNGSPLTGSFTFSAHLPVASVGSENPGNPFNGSIDDFRFYANRALSPTDMTTLYGYR